MAKMEDRLAEVEQGSQRVRVTPAERTELQEIPVLMVIQARQVEF
jgi:hypothetical protein